MRNKIAFKLLCSLLCVGLLCSCGASSKEEPKQPSETNAFVGDYVYIPEEEKIQLPLSIGDNVIRVSGYYYQVLQPEEYTVGDMSSYTFLDSVTFMGNEDRATELLEAGRNPGLGVRALNAAGVTGKGVRVAVIDQPMILGNEELGDRVVAYKDFDSETPEDEGSMHGLSVASILAGATAGIAPEALVYYAAVPTWNMDATNYADAMNWLLETNESLPENDKIRIISVSAAPSEDYFDNGELWTVAVKKAKDAGVFVIDCRMEADTGFAFSSYHDIFDPDNIEKSVAGYTYDDDTDYTTEFWSNFLFAPASQRTLPQEYTAGKKFYRYDGFGGQSWAVPYVAGVAALGYQVKPDMTSEQCKTLLFETVWQNEGGVKFVNPPEFIKAVKALSD